MMDETIDPEKLAAFLDGTLTESERDAVLERLAESPAAYEAFADAAAVLSSGVGDAAGARPKAHAYITPRRRFLPFAWTAGLGAGVALAGIFLVVPLIDARTPVDAVAAAASLGLSGTPLTARLGADWADVNWRVDRSATQPLAPEAIAFRAGIRVLDIEAAIASADAAALAAARSDLAALIATVSGSPPFVARYSEITASSRPAQRSRLAGDLRELLNASPWFELGVWCETARLAVALSSEDFDARARRLRVLTDRLAIAADARSAATLPPLHEIADLLERGLRPDERPAFLRHIDTVLVLGAR